MAECLEASTLKRAAQRFIEEHLPDEVLWFSAVWEGAVHAGLLSDRQFETGDPAAPLEILIRDLGAQSPTADTSLQSPWAVAVLVQAGRVLRRRESLTMTEVRGAIEAAARMVDIPRKLRSLLIDHGALILAMEISPQLAESMSATLTASSVASLAAPDQKDRGDRGDEGVYWVEYSRGDAEEGRIIVHARFMWLNEVENITRPPQTGNWLCVDEPGNRLHAIGPEGEKRSALRRLPKQSRLMLSLVLRAFQTRQIITFDDIARSVLGLLDQGGVSRNTLQKQKSNLDKALKGIVGTVLHAEPEETLYYLEGQIPYCWIREDRNASLLDPSIQDHDRQM